IAIAALVVGTVAGLGIGLVRIMQGGHFLSDVIASGLMVWVAAHLTWERIRASRDVVGLALRTNQGQSAAILTGLHHAQGEFCVVMDGDGQNDPADIATLLAAWRDGSADVVCGFRKNRRDTWNKI